MYTVTFYSFKGGVGRSMALVNVGVQLALAGKKVLLVDFDLEAPGLPTFHLCRPTNDSLGLVDFVTEYIESGAAPEVKNYLYKSHSFDTKGELWVMPVGKQDANYSSRLNSINWQRLYSHQNGFLLFEDLKRQWKESISPDYVLIDSRTGHSDVEGICTRQLPDAVSLLFFPNEQNMSGLGRVTGSIRSYLERNPQRQITLHYAVSNVPDLDDEDHILDAILEKCKTQLGYEELAAEIHHYNSLSLLDQEIFSLSRPNSRLTREYKKLASAISRQNLEDRNAVVELLKKLRSDFSLITFDNDPDELRTKIETILQNFPQDGEICFLVALVHNQLGNIDDALSLLSTASVEEGYRTAHMFAVRARLHHRIGKEKDAERDLIQMLQSPNADFETFMDAISLAEQMCPELFSLLPDSVALTSLVPHEQLFVASQCDSGKIQISTKIAILNRLQQETLEEEFKDSVRHLLAMSYIALGNFSESLNIFETFNTAPPNKRISDIFNFAMAKWGLEGAPSLEVFERIREIDNRSISSAHGDPNYSQCLALTNAILGHTEKAQQYLNYARTAIAERPRREFSAWSYQRELPPEFLKHLDIIETILSGERPLPQFMHQNRLHLDTTK